MAVLVSDSFNRADSTTVLGSTDSFNGGTSQAWSFLNSSVWGISTNQAYTSTAHIDSIAYVGTQSDNVKITLSVANSNVYTNGIAFRVQDGNNLFRAYISATSLKIDRKLSGTWSNIGSFTVSTQTFPLSISVGLSGTTITFYVNGISQFSVTDTNFQTAANHGLYINNNGGTIKQDSFIVESTSTGTDASITAVIANATASALIPSISTGNNVTSVIGSATATGVAPQVGSITNATVNAVIASLVAEAVAPSVTVLQGTQIDSVVAGVTANVILPTIRTDGMISAIIAGLQATAFAPNINGKNIIGTITLKGNQQLNVYLVGNQALNVNLKGVIN